MTITFEPQAINRVTHLAVGLSDGESWGWSYDAGTDGRSVRGVAVKPVTNGQFTWWVEATDSAGCTVRQAGPDTVIVVSRQ